VLVTPPVVLVVAGMAVVVVAEPASAQARTSRRSKGRGRFICHSMIWRLSRVRGKRRDYVALRRADAQ
jgi:hypothetical protein